MQRGQQLSLEKVEEMWEHFFTNQSNRYVAKATGVSRATVKRYATLGDPARGIEPFWERLRRVVTETHKRVEKRIIYTNMEIKANTQAQVVMADRILAIAAQKLLQEVRDGKPTMTSWAKLWAERNNTIRRMVPFDERDVTDEHTTSATVHDEFAGRSDAEIDYYVANNRWPNKAELAEFRVKVGEGEDGQPIDVEAEHQRWGAEGDEDDDDTETDA